MGEKREIARAAGLVGGLTLCSRIAGLARDVVIGAFFGATPAADAFFVAFRIPNLLRRFVAEGAMNVAFVPIFTDYLTRRSRNEAVRAARALFTVMALGLGLLTLLGISLAPLWVSLLAPGFAALPGQSELTTRLTRWLFPYVFLIGLAALLGGILNSLRHFFAPALSPVLLNLAVIAAALTLTQELDVPVLALALGVLAGGLLQLGAQLVPMRRLGFDLRPVWEPGHPAIRKVARLLVPTVFGAAVYQLNVVVGTIFASVLVPGSVSFLWYADRIFEFPLGLFATALGTAALPSLATQAVRREFAEMRSSIAFALGIAGFIALPAMVGLLVLAEPIVHVLFERGSFGATDVTMTAAALRMFALGLWPVSAVRVLIPAFYALGDARTPVLTATGAFVANVVFSLMLMGPIASADATGQTLAGTSAGGGAFVFLLSRAAEHLALADLGHAGLALATSLSAAVNVGLLAFPLGRRLGGLGLGQASVSLARSALASIAMGMLVWWLAGLYCASSGSAVRDAAALLSVIALGVGFHLVTVHLLGSPETRAALRAARTPSTAR